MRWYDGGGGVGEMVCSPALPLDLNRAERNPSIPNYQHCLF